MAGTFTHWMIVERALNNLREQAKKHKYIPLILSRYQFVILGAIGPDYPYLTHIIKNKIFKCHSWADRMHYENTGGMVRCGLEYLTKLNKNAENFKICLAWLCGYTSHLIADSIIHPVVNSIVGPYIFNADEHRTCEMVQDSFIFKSITDGELPEVATTDKGYGGYIDHIRRCSDAQNRNRLNSAIKKFWMEILRSNYPKGQDKFHDIEFDEWHVQLLKKLSLATDPIPIFRDIGEQQGLVYEKTTDIPSNDKKRFFEEVPLPNKDGTFHFEKHVFNKAVSEVVRVWNNLFDDIEKGVILHCKSYIRNWNLDTGVNEDEIDSWVEERA